MLLIEITYQMQEGANFVLWLQQKSVHVIAVAPKWRLFAPLKINFKCISL
jgi:hypothetical protein